MREGDNLFCASMVALEAKTGKYRWHFQQVHHDIWDYDAASPVVLFDTVIDGQQRLIVNCGGPGALPGQFDGVHQIHVDSARNLYVTEVSNDRSQMFRPKTNADPNKIIGPMATVSARSARP